MIIAPPTDIVAPKPSLILHPGIRALADNVERYVVEGGGSVIIEVGAGDVIEVIDLEGWQACEIIGIGKDGRFDAAVLGEKPSNDADGFKAILTNGDESADKALAALKRRNIDIKDAKSVRVFGEASRAGSKAEFTVQQEGIAIIAAPGGVMDFDAQDTATPIEIFVRRTKARKNKSHPLPEPLADPVQDIRIACATAESFTVKEGEYIQIIDVDGRQCSDFQAFSRRKLDAGNEQALDATVTRSLIGLINPIPGLPAKTFDQEMEPLVEVIQDTCGRHDVFMTACNAKYYDEMG